MKTDPLVQTAQISSGTIEYALVGSGPTILMSHGSLGGVDQSLAIAGLFDQTAFSFLCVSRAGYRQSSPETGRTVADQSQSYAELLDQLGIASVAVMGLSGGAPSVLDFAQRFPARCWALVLLSSISQTPELPPFFQLAVRFQSLMMGIEPLWRMVYKRGLRFLVRSNGVSAEQAAAIFDDPHLREVVAGIYQPITSTRVRRAGLALDDDHIQSLTPVADGAIVVPTFIGHAVDDPLAPVGAAAELAERVISAEYHEFPDGGHLFFVVHSQTLAPQVEQFLRENAPR